MPEFRVEFETVERNGYRTYITADDLAAAQRAARELDYSEGTWVGGDTIEVTINLVELSG